MKRSGPPQRRTPLRRSEGLARTSGLERQTPLARGQGLARSARPAEPKGGRVPPEVAAEAMMLGRLRCASCASGSRLTLHHVLPRRLFPEAAQLAENLVVLCWPCHDAHERAMPRLPLRCVPCCALDLARRLGPAAEDYVKRTYPEEG